MVLKYRTRIVKLHCKSLPALYCVDLFSYKVYREMPIQSYVTDNELEAVLNVIDMDSDKWKRDKVIILLAASTGMRACDIIRMQLTDIDWRRGEIRIVQHMYGMLFRKNNIC